MSSYRPVILLPVMGKLLGKLMATRLLPRLEGMSANQFGFRQGCSTEDALLSLRNILEGCECNYVLRCFFDFKGAFDNVE